MGQVKIKDLDGGKSKKIQCSKHPTQCIEMDFDGRFLASTSTKGTIIRIFRLDNLECIQEFRRGMDNANILSLNFTLSGSLLSCSSDSGTVHIFKINYFDEISDTQSTLSGQTNNNSGGKERKKKRTLFRKAIPYFNSQWSSSSLKIKEKRVLVDFNKAADDLIIYIKHGKIYK